ncbi:MAG TPA: hypothetical protein VGF71_06605, partial [Caulobacteraceae bacterium]
TLVTVAFFINYPGRISPDSLYMLTQAAHPAVLNNWHEPITTSFWIVFDPILLPPAGALLVQSLILLVYPSIMLGRSTISLFSAGLRSPHFEPALFHIVYNSILIAALVCLAGTILKDVVLAGLIMCILAVVDARELEYTKRVRISLAFILLILVSLVRPTNFVILAAVLCTWTYIYVKAWSKRILVTIAICLFSVALIPAEKILDRTVFHAQDGHADSSLIIFDAAGISTSIHKDIFRELPGWPSDKLLPPWRCYSPISWGQFGWGDCEHYSTAFLNLKLNDLAWWIEIIAKHPVAYAEHRARFTYALFADTYPLASFHNPYALNVNSRLIDYGQYTLGYDMRDRFQLWRPSIAELPFEWVAAILFSRPMLLVVLAIFLTGVSKAVADWRARQQVDQTEVTALAMGIANLVMLAVFGVGADTRFLLPSFLCAYVVAIRRTLPKRAPLFQVASANSLSPGGKRSRS